MLIEGGVDVLLIEMIFDMLNLKVVLFVVEGVFEEIGWKLLVMISVMIMDVLGCMFLG